MRKQGVTTAAADRSVRSVIENRSGPNMIRRGSPKIVAGAAVVAIAVALSQAAAAGAPPGLTEAQILRIALRAAARSGDPRPTLIQHAAGTRADANRVAYGGPVGGSAWSILIAERGKFIGYGASIPLGAQLPRGTVTTLIVNAATGQVTDDGISYRYPPLAQLGPVTTDFRSYSSCPANGRRQLTSTAAGSSGQLVPGVPTGVLLCRYSGLNPTPSAAGRLLAHRLIADPGTVGQMRHEFDSLKPFQPGAYSCPADFGAKIVAIFRYAGGRSDDPVTLDPNGCTSVTNGKLVRTAMFPPGPKLIGRLETLTTPVR